ncbi:NAD(P)H nitroreductase [Methylocystis heyeri]|uniref:Putative NAD(P)H nitroreductase n=1 Tax=Methylocystis heyeri TaxID=391905 RepID=A0A6B8KGL9_9HYPH|nr:NAD(P)H nitroreductase [Methylocystis heyeri]QGM46867.1 NAD(P)H nitroreductase [Methylocystis heyeri]
MGTPVLNLLLERRSCSSLGEPAPDEQALDVIFRAALRVPDFQRLRPYRFLVASGDGLHRLGALMQDAARQSGLADEIVDRALGMPKRAPMVVVVAAIHRPHKVVTPFEQQLTAGCAVMAMQMAAFAQGYGGIWRSGWPMFNRTLHSALGLAEADQIVGFLYLGTPTAEPKNPLPGAEWASFVQWL